MKISAKGRSLRNSVIGIAIVFMLGSDIALAQLEEIVVTARRLEESLRDVPIAVSPFTAESIQNLNLRNIDDIARFTPGLSFNSAFGRQGGSDRPTIRGISTIQNGVGNASAAAYFVDGIYLGGSPQSTELFNVQRVEILKGPQAAQFGRGTYIGAINYVTRGRSEEFEGDVRASAGQDGYGAVSGWVGGRISDTVGYYVSGGYDTFDGQYVNNWDNNLVGGERTGSVTGKLFFEPSESFDLELKVGYQHQRDKHFPIYLQPRGLNTCCFRGAAGSGIAPRAREYYEGDAVEDWNQIALRTDLIALAGPPGVTNDRTLASLRLNWEIVQDITLSSITGYIKDEIETGFDASYAAYEPFVFPTFLNGAFIQYDKDDQTDISQELRVTFNNIENLRITLGGYYYEGEVEEISDLFVTFAGVVTPINPFVGEESLQTEEIENLAIFGGIDWSIGDNITLGFEARYAEDEITVFDRTRTGTGFCTKETCNETFESFTPRFTAVFNATEDTNIYANIAKGTKPGGFNNNIPSDRPDLRTVDEETAWNYEVGVKSALFDNRAQLNVAGYFLDVEDQQLTTVIELAGGSTTSVLQNVGKTEVYGLEFDTTFLLTDDLTAAITYGWTQSEITERISRDEADLNGWGGFPSDLAQFGDVSGRRSPRAPEHQFSVNGRYEKPFSTDGRWWFAADWTYESSRYSQEHNKIETGSRDVLGLQAGIGWGNWELTVWGRNVLDNTTPIDILRYIDRRSGSLPSCNSVYGGPPFPTLPQCSGQSTSPRGFALTAPRGSYWGATIAFRFGAQAP
ncbi:MAG: TonB-dependent receptor [Gammaproteobacteria bacterium]|nr:TonB-dependent receptor [Gammaproteobacteria bacterium]